MVKIIESGQNVSVNRLSVDVISQFDDPQSCLSDSSATSVKVKFRNRVILIH